MLSEQRNENLLLFLGHNDVERWTLDLLTSCFIDHLLTVLGLDEGDGHWS